ncbi:four helix bundle protein [Aquirufa sp. Wall-65K1]
MKSDNIIQIKSFQFALLVIRFVRQIQLDKKEYVLSKQILRSGTSIGANVEEAVGGSSRRDFYAKMHIAYKEARETGYWIRLLRESNIYQ